MMASSLAPAADDDDGSAAASSSCASFGVDRNGSSSASASAASLKVTVKEAGDYAAEGCLEQTLHPVLKRCLSPLWITVVLMLYGVLASAEVNGLFASSASSVQRSLDLSAMDWGLVASMYEVYLIVLVPLVSYFGGRTHIPRFLGYCLAFFAAGSFLFAVPHFAFYRPDDAIAGTASSAAFCQSAEEEGCSGGPTSGPNTVTLAILVFMLAQLMVSIGASALWILGAIYLDRNVSQQKMNMYLSALYASAALGPAVGYLMNGKLLDHWIDPSNPPPDGLTPKSSMWMGNWWMGYMIFGGISFVFLPVLSCFPRYLPGTVAVRKAKLKSGELVMINSQPRQREGEEEEDSTFRVDSSSPTAKAALVRRSGAARDARAFFAACRDILTPMRVFNMLAHGTENFAVSALSTFMPQIIEAQFGLSPAQTSIVFGLTIVVGATSGIVAGGWFVSWRKYDGVETARFCWIAALLALPFTFSFLLMGCSEKPEVSNLDLQLTRNLEAALSYGNGTVNALLTETCNAGCLCSETEPDLVCIDGQTFYSSCYAGCSLVEEMSNGTEVALMSSTDLSALLLEEEDGTAQVSIQCSCAQGTESLADIKPGYCKDPKKCGKELIFFLIGLFLLMFFTFLNNVPGSQVILRSTKLAERPLAMALKSITYRLTGSLPAPLLMGFALDKLCLIHSFVSTCDTTGTDGQCLLADNQKVKRLCLLVGLVFKVLSFVFLLVSWILYKRHKV